MYICIYCTYVCISVNASMESVQQWLLTVMFVVMDKQSVAAAVTVVNNIFAKLIKRIHTCLFGCVCVCEYCTCMRT